MDFLNKFFFEFIIDKNRRLPAKLLTVLAVLFCLYLLNDLLGFAYYYNAKNKIEQVKAISEVLRDSTLSPEIRKQASSLQLRLFKRKNIFEKTFTFAYSEYDSLRAYFAGHYSRTKVVKSTEGRTVVVATQPLPQRNEFLFTATAAGIFIVLAVLMVPVSFYLGIDQGVGTGVSAVIILIGGFSFVACIFYLVLSLIPPLWGSWVANYFINSIVQLFSIFIAILYAVKKNKKYNIQL